MKNGVTGYVVERLPPGRKWMVNDDDEACLCLYLDAIHQAESLERQDVRSHAAADFATGSIVDGLITTLYQQRTIGWRKPDCGSPTAAPSVLSHGCNGIAS